MQFPKLAVVTAGGEGTRLRPLTYETPKPLVDVQGKPIIEHVLDEVFSHSIERAILTLGYKADKIIAHLRGGPYSDRIEFVVEPKALGTGGSLRNARGAILRHDPSAFFVINGDQLMLMPMEEQFGLHSKRNAQVTLLLRHNDVEGFGVAVLDGDRIVRFVEKPKPEEAPSDLVNAGLYLLDASVLGMLPEKETFSLERDFFTPLAGTGPIFGFVKNELWLCTDDMKRLENARKNWVPRAVAQSLL